MAPTIAASSCLGKWIEAIVKSLSESEAYQEFAQVGVGDTVGAKSKIYVDDIPTPADGSEAYAESEWLQLHPHCLVMYPDDGGTFSFTRTATGPVWDRALACILWFERIVPPSDVRSDEDIDFEMRDIVGRIIEDLAANTYAVGYADITDIREAGQMVRLPPRDWQELGDLQAWAIRVSRES